MTKRPLCILLDCSNPNDTRGLCGKHHQRRLKHGSPLWEPPTPEQRFWAKVDKTSDPNGCWIWLGKTAANGYGGYNNSSAHRNAYTTMVGPIPEGLQLDHLCEVKLCVNPRHLEPVTPKENCRRRDIALGIGSAKTHCPKGHEYTEENTSRRNARRHCRACDRERARANKARTRKSEETNI